MHISLLKFHDIMHKIRLENLVILLMIGKKNYFKITLNFPFGLSKYTNFMGN